MDSSLGEPIECDRCGLPLKVDELVYAIVPMYLRGHTLIHPACAEPSDLVECVLECKSLNRARI